jgi:hypothetical protein
LVTAFFVLREVVGFGVCCQRRLELVGLTLAGFNLVGSLLFGSSWMAGTLKRHHVPQQVRGKGRKEIY